MATSTVIINSNDGVSSETPASPGTAKIRVTGNTLEASVNAGAYSVISTAATSTILSGGDEDLAPVQAIEGSAVELLSVSAGTLTAVRTVQINVEGTAYSTGANTVFEFYADVNGTPLARRRLMFNPSSQHLAFAGSWIVELPAEAVTIKLYGIRMAGAGTITMNSDDFVNLTYFG